MGELKEIIKEFTKVQYVDLANKDTILTESNAFQALKRLANKEGKTVIKSGESFLDILTSLGHEYKLTIERSSMQGSFTITELEGGRSTTGTMPLDHHCDLDRISQLTDFLIKRLKSDTSENNPEWMTGFRIDDHFAPVRMEEMGIVYFKNPVLNGFGGLDIEYHQQVLVSAAGYYIGSLSMEEDVQTDNEGNDRIGQFWQPESRDSQDYWELRKEAEDALISGNFKPKF